MAVQGKRASLSLSCQHINNTQLAMSTQAPALEKLGQSVNMDIFQELIDLDTPSEIFSKNVVCEYLVMAPEMLRTMNESLYV